jgi:hypothetical protein
MQRKYTFLVAAVALVATSACATTSFSSTWRAPDAQPVGELNGQVVVAMVLAKNPGTRRAAEDALAGELTRNGAKGVAGYTIVDDGMVGNEAAARAAIEKTGAAGVVVMRPIGSEKELVVTSTMYAGPMYGPYWGGYYGHGWGAAYGGTDVRTDTIVSVETLVYSLKQNKLIWAGQSKTTNPSRVDSFVRELASHAAREMRRSGLLAPRS